MWQELLGTCWRRRLPSCAACSPEWIEEEETISERLIPVENSVYDHVIWQSEIEKRFVERVKKRNDVRFFVKLPGWFKVATLVMEQTDAFGDQGPVLYLVRETKSTTVGSGLRGTENQKNHCGKEHFVGALDVDYRVITLADELP